MANAENSQATAKTLLQSALLMLLIFCSMSDAQEDLVRQVVLPAFFEALQVDMAEELHQMQPVYRLAHWKEMLLVSLRNGRWLRAGNAQLLKASRFRGSRL